MFVNTDTYLFIVVRFFAEPVLERCLMSRFFAEFILSEVEGLRMTREIRMPVKAEAKGSE